MANQGHSIEISLRLLLPAASVAALRRHPLVCRSAIATPHQEIRHDTYFDTPAWGVHAAAAALRIRHGGARAAPVQALDGAAATWQAPVAGQAPDLAALRGAIRHKGRCAELARLAALDGRLAPVFAIYVEHTVWALRVGPGGQLAMALDEGFIECGARRVPVSEIELTLKSGDPAHLFDFALALQRDIGLHIATSVTAERAYRLAASQAPVAAKARPPALSRQMTVEQAFEAIAQHCLAQIQASQEGVAEGHDARSVHQMRAGLQRWQSATRLFRGVLKVPGDLQQEIDWLAGELTAACDWDELAQSTLPAVARGVPQAGQLAELQRAVAAIAAAKRRAAAAAVDAQRTTRLMLSFARWICCRGWRPESTPAMRARLAARARPFAGDALLRDCQRLLRRGNQLAGADAAARDMVLVAAGRSRHATRFFESLCGSASVRRYRKALTALHDELCRLNDAAVAARLLKELSARNRNLEGSAEFVRGYLASQRHAQECIVLKRWNKLARLTVHA